MSNLFWLTNAQMEHLQPFFPKSHGKLRVGEHRVLSGIVFVSATGCAGVMRRARMARTRRCTIGGSAGASEAYSAA